LHRPKALHRLSGDPSHQRSTLRCKIIVRDFSASAPLRPRPIVLSKHFAQDDQQYCQEYQQCALQNDAINLPKLWLAMIPPLCASCAAIFTGKNA
jgi:hypothetical protein